METILVVGATGNIGVSAVQAALHSKRKVLAIVRNQESAEKLFKYSGTKEGITIVEADVTADNGVQGVVDQVKAGKLPAFQHVFTCVGGRYEGTSMVEMSTTLLRDHMNRGFEANFFAYRAAIPYLLSHPDTHSTFTICTGAQGDIGAFAGPALTQGALFSMANTASKENADTNVRFNEIYLAFRVEVDENAEKHGVTKASDFARVYEGVLEREEIRSSRVSVYDEGDISDLKFEKKEWKGKTKA